MVRPDQVELKGPAGLIVVPHNKVEAYISAGYEIFNKPKVRTESTKKKRNLIAEPTDGIDPS